MSEYGDMCRDIRKAKREARAAHGVPCPKCAEVRPKACPSILLPEQRCKVDGYRDPRKRTRETEYLTRVETPNDHP
jgi:hypothetical protein